MKVGLNSGLDICLIALALFLFMFASTVDAEEQMVYNISGVFVRIPELKVINLSHVSVVPVMINQTSLIINVTPLTPSDCDVNLSVNDPNGNVLGRVVGTARRLQTNVFTISINNTYDYVVINGTVCGTSIPVFGVRYYESKVGVPPSLDSRLLLIYNLFIYSPFICLGLRTNPRLGGVGIITALPIVIPIMLSFGANPQMLYVISGIVFIIALFMVFMK